ncbi:MAG TPA: hypothetical protein VIL26_05645 [Clostridia bacterium]
MFKYVKMASSYMFKTLPYFFFVALIPAAILGFFGPPCSNILYFYENFNVPISPMPTGFKEVLNDMFAYFKNGWILITQFSISLIFVSLIIGLMERHLRSGRFGFKRPLRRINDSLLALLPVFITALVVEILFSLISSGIVTLAHYIFSDFGRTPTILSWTVSIIAFIALQLLVIEIYSICLLVPPTYMIAGYPYLSSISYATKLRHEDSFKIYFACLWPYLVIFLVGLVSRMLNLLDIPINILCYVFVYLYFSSLSMTVYYERTGTERMDYKRKLGAGV